MMKILDYYYLVLLRWSGKLDHVPPGIMALTFWMNFVSLLMPFSSKIIGKIGESYFDSTLFFSMCLICAILLIIYSTKRQNKIKEKYKNESRESHKRGTCRVLVYELLSIAFLIWSVSTLFPK